MHNSNNFDIINTELDNYFTNDTSYKITKNDRENIVNNLLYKNVDLILEKILDNITYKNSKNMLTKKNTDYFDNLFKNCKNIINNKTKEGDTLLHNMVFFGCYDIVKLLLKHGAKVDIEDTDKQLPIHRSIFLSDIKIFNLLIKFSKNINVEINYKDKDGNTPLHLAILIKNYLIIKNLLINNADPYILNNANIVPLDLAKDKNKKFDENIIQIFKDFITL